MVIPKNSVIPNEQYFDRTSRQDELLVVQIGLLKAIAEKLGASVSVPGDGGSQTTIVSESDKSKNLAIITIPLGTADTEKRWQFPIGMKTFVMHSRNGNEVRMATHPGIVADSNEPYFTLKANTAYSQDDLNIGNIQPYPTLYFACPAADEVLEIIIGV
jgi:hypothetical protein